MKKNLFSIIALLIFSTSSFAADAWTSSRIIGDFFTTDGGGVYVAAKNSKWNKAGCNSTYAYIRPSANTNRMLSTVMFAQSQKKKIRFYGDCTGSGFYFNASRVMFEE